MAQMTGQTTRSSLAMPDPKRPPGEPPGPDRPPVIQQTEQASHARETQHPDKAFMLL